MCDILEKLLMGTRHSAGQNHYILQESDFVVVSYFH